MSDSADTMENAVETQHGCPVQDSHGQRVLHASRDQYVSVIKALADEGYEMCVDLTGVDYLAMPQRTIGFDIQAERFEVAVNLLSLSQRKRIRVRVQVPADDCTMPTLFDIHPGTEAHERETFDLFGIVFTGHPDMTRILMPEDWDGHPLRKDCSQGSIPVQFKGANS